MTRAYPAHTHTHTHTHTQLYTMTMDVHNRFRTEAHKDVVARFNERFLLSLAQCSAALVVDDELNVLPISTAAKNFLATHQPSEEERVDPVRMLIVGLFFAMH